MLSKTSNRTTLLQYLASTILYTYVCIKIIVQLFFGYNHNDEYVHRILRLVT